MIGGVLGHNFMIHHKSKLNSVSLNCSKFRLTTFLFILFCFSSIHAPVLLCVVPTREVARIQLMMLFGQNISTVCHSCSQHNSRKHVRIKAIVDFYRIES